MRLTTSRNLGPFCVLFSVKIKQLYKLYDRIINYSIIFIKCRDNCRFCHEKCNQIVEMHIYFMIK